MDSEGIQGVTHMLMEQILPSLVRMEDFEPELNN